MNISGRIEAAEAWLRARVTIKPEVVIILGSGLGSLASSVEESTVFRYGEIPHFTDSGVVGHSGQLLFGTLEGRRVAVMAGRAHLYEGHDPASLGLPLYVLQRLGVRWLLVTNASGGINPRFEPGQLVLIRDHINFMGRNPLVGPYHPDVGAQQFTDMSEPYDPALLKLAHEAAAAEGVAVAEGVYLSTLGPSFETCAEIRMFRKWGADLVGMSTVPEVLAARHVGLRVLGISCVGNAAAGMFPQPLTYEEVLETTRQVQTGFLALVRAILRRSADVEGLREES